LTLEAGLLILAVRWGKQSVNREWTSQNETRLRVRYQETDQMGVVYHANHLIYFEVGRSDLMRKRGIRYADLEKEGLRLAVTEAHANFLGHVSYDDEIVVDTAISIEGKMKVRFDYRIHSAEDDRSISEGYTLHVFLGPTGRIIRIPERVRDVIEQAGV
jgi:acyl-CoA thioester hydrolase